MESLLSDSWFSLQRVLMGVAIAVVIGVAAGLLRSQAPAWLKRNPLFRFILEAPKFPPPIAWIPFVIVMCGIGQTSAVVIVLIGAFAPLFTASYDGAESIPVIWRQTAASLGVSNWVFIREILFKGALPQIFSGLRVGLGMGWMSVIAAEMISGQSGLGYSIQLHRLNLQYSDMVVDMVAIGTIGFVLYEGVNWAEKIFLPWHERGVQR